MTEVALGELLLRDVDERVIASLQRRAARAGRSVEEEPRGILEAAASREVSEPMDRENWAREAERLRKSGPRMPRDSADVIRELRDGRSFG